MQDAVGIARHLSDGSMSLFILMLQLFFLVLENSIYIVLLHVLAEGPEGSSLLAEQD